MCQFIRTFSKDPDNSCWLNGTLMLKYRHAIYSYCRVLKGLKHYFPLIHTCWTFFSPWLFPFLLAGGLLFFLQWFFFVGGWWWWCVGLREVTLLILFFPLIQFYDRGTSTLFLSFLLSFNGTMISVLQDYLYLLECTETWDLKSQSVDCYFKCITNFKQARLFM